MRRSAQRSKATRIGRDLSRDRIFRHNAARGCAIAASCRASRYYRFPFMEFA